MPSIGQRLRDVIGHSLGADIVEQNLEKAFRELESRAASAKPQSVFYDPVTMFMGNEWLPRHSEGLSFKDLRNMAKNPIIGAIIGTRKVQVASFCQPQRDEYDHGFEIKGVNPDADKNQAKKREIANWVQHCGMDGYGEELLETWVRQFIEDSLILDQACSEIVLARNGQPSYLVNVDAGLIRRLEASLSYTRQRGEPLYVQVMDDIIRAQYTDEQMIFGVRNKKTDISYLGYGMSELETLMRAVGTIINAERYNAGHLQQGGMQKGVLVVAGDAGAQAVESFRRDFREAVRNAASSWRAPVLHVNKDAKVEWLTLDRSQRDMEYSQLFEHLVKQACGVYQIDPREINWTIGGSGTTITYEGKGDDKTRSSKMRGLAPLLTFVANQMNRNVVSRLDPNYRMSFAGFDRDKSSETDLMKTEVQTYKTVNEVRSDRGLPSLGPSGDVVLNESFVKALEGPAEVDKVEV